ncbi:HAD-IIIC family phosphatase [Oleispirillum naphthae]|uniref:HAD-IIIC family phosphatase n=1 Tax=Oleispirillum naphthae TaxID=2838853 RepID=UPI00308264E4
MSQSGPALKDLPWLCPTPPDFREACRKLSGLPDGAFAVEARRLAAHAMSESHLNQICKALDRRSAAGQSLDPLQPLTLAVAGNGTTDLLAKALRGTAVRYGFDLRVVQGAFGQISHEALDPDSEINRAAPDYVLLALDHRALPLAAGPRSPEEEAADVEKALGWVSSLCRGFQSHTHATLLLPTIPAPAAPLFGSLDARVNGAWRHLLAAVNRGIAEMAAGSGSLLLDVAGLAETVGLETWHDEALWNIAKLSFGQSLVPLYADVVLRLLAASRGQTRKCLVLDLDNTLWGGVIGDDGLDGIELGNGTARGEAFLAIQKTALALRDRGIVLAVCSKNQDEIARQPFRRHSDMLIKEDDIAVFVANWRDKAGNLRDIAKRLDIGVDALALLDDNPAERALVRRELPQVGVPELPEDPADYPRVLAWSGLFEAAAYSDEDAVRARYYADNARRSEAGAAVTDMDGYLASLGMEMTVSAFDAMGRTRITQLINKTNQFNLTTRRYTERDVLAMEQDPQVLALQIRLKDTFGDNGMISVVIGRPDGDALDLDTWLMSCRVLNRGVECATLNVVAGLARQRGFRWLRGVYRPTEKNALVRDHYRRLGFSQDGAEDGGATIWRLRLDSFSPHPHHIAVGLAVPAPHPV